MTLSLHFQALAAINAIYCTSYTIFNTIHNFFKMIAIDNIDICFKEWDKTLFLPATFRH